MDLLPKPRPAAADVSVATIMRRPTFLRAIHLAIELTGLEDKEIYSALDIDASHWTRIKSGAAHFPCDERMINFFDVVGNDVALIWLCESRGYDFSTMRRHRNSLERENEELREELANKDKVLSLALKAIAGATK